VTTLPQHADNEMRSEKQNCCNVFSTGLTNMLECPAESRMRHCMRCAPLMRHRGCSKWLASRLQHL